MSVSPVFKFSCSSAEFSIFILFLTPFSVVVCVYCRRVTQSLAAHLGIIS